MRNLHAVFFPHYFSTDPLEEIAFRVYFFFFFILEAKSGDSTALNLAPLPATRKLIEKQIKCPGGIVEQVASEL